MKTIYRNCMILIELIA